MTPNKCFINVSDNDDDQGDSITHYSNKYLLGAYVYITVQIFQDGCITFNVIPLNKIDLMYTELKVTFLLYFISINLQK